MKRFILTDNTKDAKGDIIIAQGVSLSRYEKHPILLYAHNQHVLPIGKLKDIRLEGNALTAEPEFDEGDYLAVECKRKYELGLLAVSVGIKPISIEQREGVRIIKSCELVEVSLVVIPANPNALIIKSGDDALYYSLKIHNTVDELLKKMLGLEPTTNDEQVLLSIKNMQSELVQTKSKLQEYEAKVLAQEQAAKQAQAIQLYEKAFEAGKVTALQKDFIIKSALADYPATQQYVSTLPTLNKSVLAQMQQAGGVNVLEKKLAERKEWTFSDWQKKDSKGLADIKSNHPEVYQELLATLKQ